MKVFELVFGESTCYQCDILPNYNDCDPKALKLLYNFSGKYARRANLHVNVTAKRNFIILIGETLQQYIWPKNDEDLSGRHEDIY